jgi:hypothetical protein
MRDSIDEKVADSGHVTAKFVLDTVSTAIEKCTTTLHWPENCDGCKSGRK